MSFSALPDSDKRGAGAADPLVEAPAPPTCERHGLEKHRVTDRQKSAGLKWRCRDCQREADARYDQAHPGRREARKARLAAAGLCVACGKEPPVTQTYCFDCATQRLEAAVLYR